MGITPNLLDREREKFVESPSRPNQPAIEVISSGKLIPPAEADAMTVAYPNSSTEVYSYRVGGVSGSVVKTITVVYTSPSKNDILSVVGS
jgi:hypothetical protein